MKYIEIIGAIISVVLIATCGYWYITGSNKEKDIEYVTEEYFRTVNEYRIDNNHVPLTWDNQLASLALEHSQWMDENDELEHSHNGYYEIIMDTGSGHLDLTPEFMKDKYMMIKPWIDSKRHNDILLSDNIYYGAIGVSGKFVTLLAR